MELKERDREKISMWKCPKCGREFKKKGQSHYCGEKPKTIQECELIQTCNLRACSDNCNLCQKACQTRALSAPYTFNPMRCVSLWTTFGKGFVPPFLKRVQFGNWICGCDACQDACPYNKKVNWNEGIAFSNLQEIAEDIQPEKLLSHSNEYLIKEVISKTDQHLKPSNVHVLKRNAKRVLGSHRRQK